jgi:peptide/nickel transport system permease protein/oligopeptide transport system permease protein
MANFQLNRFRQEKPYAFICGIVFFILLFISLISPSLFSEHLKVTSPHSLSPPGFYNSELSVYHLLGTDVNGHDLAYRLLSGLQISILIGLLGAAIALFIGTFYGMISGYIGGYTDIIMMRLVDALYAVPRILIIMILIAALDKPCKNSLDNLRLYAQEAQWLTLELWLKSLIPYSKLLVMILTLGMIEWLTMARIVRAQVLLLKQQTFIYAAKSMGQKTSKILRLHLIPNLTSLVLTYTTLTIPTVILDESILSFLGLGVEDPAASLGSLFRDGALAINPIHFTWWLLIFPALTLISLLLMLNTIGDALRDWFDPKQRNH